MTNLLFVLVGIVMIIGSLVIGIETYGWIGIMTTLGAAASGYIMVYLILKAILG